MLRLFINPIYFWKDVFELVPAKASNIEGFSN
ncbi:hypothetical protein JL09_g5395 [Pichia kudriavzevii]|uniref:Uncharacterized protein n=1 Tax=Pichia kudriavzevii TaxID=4909 RepID=A0A099NSB9_PICKU|nr:hypothetical protein JL09_g5395 [Pichia kudriavzevii]